MPETPNSRCHPFSAWSRRLCGGFAALALSFGTGAARADEANLALRRSVEQAMHRANTYYQNNFPIGNAGWNRSAYHVGNLRSWQYLGVRRDLDYAVAWAAANNWTRGPEGPAHADAHCCGQVYIDLFRHDPQPQRIANIKSTMDALLGDPEAADDWWWIDAFFMAAPTFAKLGVTYENTAYFAQLETMYLHMKNTRQLFDPAHGLWYRDAAAKARSGANTPEFWGRGNGWVIAGCALLLEELPAGDPRRAEFAAMLQTMAAALLPWQGTDGFWRSNILFPGHFSNPETSCTAFFTYAIAYGINAGLLDPTTYTPVVMNAWNGMTQNALHPSGKLGYVQAVGLDPKPATFDGDQDYGYGAYLLAGVEILRILGGPAPATVGTVGYWRFENGAFTSDSSAAGYTLTENGTVRQVAIGDNAEGTGGIPATVPGPGMANGFAASLVDEAGTIRQGYFSLGGTSATFAPDTFTIEAIVSLRTDIPGTSPDGNAIASLWSSTTNNRVWGLQVANVNGSVSSTAGFQPQELAFVFATDGAQFASRKVIGSGFALTTGRTYYVAVSYRKPSAQDEPDGLVKFWFQDLDGGTLLTSAAVTSDQMWEPTTEVPFQIGTLNLGDPLRWGGVIDEVRFSDAVVAPAQLLAKAGAYHDWAAAVGLDGTPGLAANFSDDADSDTIANGLEWILGGNPLAQDAAGLVTPQGDTATGLTLEFTRSKDSLAETTLAVRWDSGLDGTWPGQVAIGATSSGPDANGVTVAIDAAADPDLVTVLIPASNAPAGRIFARLEATQNP